MAQNGRPAMPATDPNPNQVPEGVTPEMLRQAENVQVAVNKGVNAVIGTIIRGLFVSFPGIPSHVVAETIAHHTGHTLAAAFQGDLIPVLGIRKDLKKAFEEGVQKAPLTPAGAMPPPPGA